MHRHQQWTAGSRGCKIPHDSESCNEHHERRGGKLRQSNTHVYQLGCVTERPSSSPSLRPQRLSFFVAVACLLLCYYSSLQHHIRQCHPGTNKGKPSKLFSDAHSLKEHNFGLLSLFSFLLLLARRQDGWYQINVRSSPPLCTRRDHQPEASRTHNQSTNEQVFIFCILLVAR